MPSLLNAVTSFRRRFVSAAAFATKAQAEGRLTRRDLAWRAGVVTLCVIIVTGASTAIGPYFSGVFAFFPVAMGSFFIILHPRVGGQRRRRASPRICKRR